MLEVFIYGSHMLRHVYVLQHQYPVRCQESSLLITRKGNIFPPDKEQSIRKILNEGQCFNS